MDRTKPVERLRHLAVVALRAGTTPTAEDTGHAATEVVIDGRRYRLVPTETAVLASKKGRFALAKLLTARELQIAALVAEGRVNKQIAAELNISEWTVSTHLRRIFAKLDVDTRAAMVSKCFDALSSLRGS
jgi:DNA-binding CsgD family transcriptional regulator